MDCTVIVGPESINYTSELIGVYATLGGTVLGWLLGMISNNMGKMYVYVDKYEDRKSNKREYAFISRIYVYNSTNKQRCLRNVRLVFNDRVNNTLLDIKPSIGKCSFDTVKAQKRNIVGIVKINSLAQEEFDISSLIDGENFENLSNAKTIYLEYEDMKNRTKKILIKSDFSLDNVEKTKTDSFL
jgi:hypothetical protein